MKALSVRQPWAFFIVQGIKDEEYRPRCTKFRGTVLVHASKRVDRAPFRMFVEQLQREHVDLPLLPRGFIVGAVDIADCERGDGDCAWILRNPRVALHPIPYTGRLGLFEVPDDIVDKLQLAPPTE